MRERRAFWLGRYSILSHFAIPTYVNNSHLFKSVTGDNMTTSTAAGNPVERSQGTKTEGSVSDVTEPSFQTSSSYSFTILKTSEVVPWVTFTIYTPLGYPSAKVILPVD